MLRIAILSLLADNDYSGYDLSKAFDASLTYVWAASQSQIYPELKKLESKGLIKGVDVAQEGRPDKRVYRITRAGRAALIDWAEEVPDTLAIRDRFQLTVINIGRLDPERARDLIRAQRDLLQQRVDVLTSIADLLDHTGHRPGEPWNDQLGWRLTVEAGLRITAAYLDWCEWASRKLAASAKKPPSVAGAPVRP